eukprot:scaffold18726_cov63-Phaeocystis_antarctica.AAC.2
MEQNFLSISQIAQTPPQIAARPLRTTRISLRPNSYFEIASEMATMLRVLFIMLVASYTNALIVGTKPSMVPRVQLRAQEAPPPPPKGKLGATVDQDGKSNVWVRCCASRAACGACCLACR